MISKSKILTDINIFFTWCSENLAEEKHDDKPLTNDVNTEFFKERIEKDEEGMRLN